MIELMIGKEIGDMPRYQQPVARGADALGWVAYDLLANYPKGAVSRRRAGSFIRSVAEAVETRARLAVEAGRTGLNGYARPGVDRIMSRSLTAADEVIHSAPSVARQSGELALFVSSSAAIAATSPAIIAIQGIRDRESDRPTAPPTTPETAHPTLEAPTESGSTTLALTVSAENPLQEESRVQPITTSQSYLEVAPA